MASLSIINAAVFDGVSDGLADGPVHVADGRIVSVGGPSQPADQVIDARGGTVLPGPDRRALPRLRHRPGHDGNRVAAAQLRRAGRRPAPGPGPGPRFHHGA